MTTHQIEADKVVVEDDRRKEQWPHNHLTRRLSEDYSQPYKIIYVPVEPELLEGAFHPMMNDVPFSPEDTLILLEEWWKGAIKINRNIFIPYHFNHTFDDWELRELDITKQPASTMPSFVDSECQQYNVVKVLGVEERDSYEDVGDNHTVFKRWNWKLLGKEIK